MHLQIYTQIGFEELPTELQQREILFLYGFTLARIARLDNEFIFLIIQNKFIFEGSFVGKVIPDYKKEKLQKHYAIATVGMLVNDLKSIYNTSAIPKLDILLLEHVRIRNLLVHDYMKVHLDHLTNAELRGLIYVDLLKAVDALNEFEFLMNQDHWLFTKKNPQYGLRFKFNEEKNRILSDNKNASSQAVKNIH